MSERILAPAALVITTATAMSGAVITLLLSAPATDPAAGFAGGDVLPFLREVLAVIADSFWALIQYL
jgi:hypothetical protein